MNPAAEPSQGNVKPFAKLAALGEDVLAETFVAKFDEKVLLLKYLLNFSFGNCLALAGFGNGP
jgi:hypothetical protein